MAITVEYGGATFRCDSERDLAAVVSLLGIRPAKRSASESRNEVARDDESSRALQLLRLVNDAGKDGIPSSELAVALRLGSPKGLGPLGTKADALLNDRCKLRLTDVIVRKRDSQAVRRWYPRSNKLATALEVFGA